MGSDKILSLVETYNSNKPVAEIKPEENILEFLILTELERNFSLYPWDYLPRKVLLSNVNFRRAFYGLEEEVEDIDLRKAILRLRKEGAIILSSSGKKGGYKKDLSLEEVKDFLENEFRGRAISLLDTLGKIRRPAERKYGGQLVFDIPTEPGPEDIRIFGENGEFISTGKPCPSCRSTELVIEEVFEGIFRFVFVECSECYLRGPRVPAKVDLVDYTEAVFRVWNELPRSI